MKLKAITAALAGAGMLALVSGSAQAGAMAGTMVQFNNFQILKSPGVQIDASDLIGLSFTSTMDMSATLRGTTAGPYDQTDFVFNNGIDAPATCVGTGCVGAINFTTNNLFPTPLAPVQGDYAAVDQQENGSPITGLTGYVGLAQVRNAAYVGMAAGSGSATTTSNNNLQASWTFTAGYTGEMTFEYDLTVFLQTFLDGQEIAPTFATANWDVNLSIICLDGAACLANGGQLAASFSPNPLLGGLGPHTVSLNAPTGSGAELAFFDTQSFSQLFNVNAGLRYQLSARVNTLADLERLQVPEPGALALLGLGLLGLGATLRKKAV